MAQGVGNMNSTPFLRLTCPQVERLRDGVTPTLGLEVKYPFESPRKNTLLYLTNVTSSNVSMLPWICKRMRRNRPTFMSFSPYSADDV